MKDTPIFSPSELTAEAFKELLPDFFEEIKEDVQLLKSVFFEENTEEAIRLSHKIKGCAASYAATLMNEKAFALQVALSHQTTEVIIKILEEFEEAISRTHEYAREHFLIE